MDPQTLSDSLSRVLPLLDDDEFGQVERLVARLMANGEDRILLLDELAGIVHCHIDRVGRIQG